ncbi:ureidoglycolate hydrolase-like protein [Pyrenochaeta sp. DS3sAY3a]|nr:ureidoglycolate hydrolase-like protein [Pyrenochaeta sp. DS3sAY3a]
MPSSMPAPAIRIPIELLTPTAFNQFGTVIENPADSPSARLPISQRVPPPDSVSANQGFATKYLDVTHMSNLYNLAPSKKPAKAVMNMFVCKPRDLRPHEPSMSLPSSWGDLDLDDDGEDDDGKFDRQLLDIGILERHPFTTQTFIPMGLSAHDRHTQYLVIVAPTLPASASRRYSDRPPPYPTPTLERRKSIRDIFARARPAPYASDASPPSQFSRLHPSARPKGPGLPDLKNIRAFVATGSQAVTYGAGTWHAPMVVIGDRPIDFVVVQFANDVGNEDCQEILLKPGSSAQEGVVVLVDADSAGTVQVKAGVGAVKARL